MANVNTPEEYEHARSRLGPDVRVGAPGRGRRTVRAASVGEAALAVGVALDRHVLVTVNGDQIVADPRLPLVAGDTVAFRTADAGG